MVFPSNRVRIVVATRPVDFRTGQVGLAAVVKRTLRRDPFTGTIFGFRAKRADRVKRNQRRIDCAGGWTALALGGLRADFEGYAVHCRTAPPSPWQRADLILRGGGDLKAYSMKDWNADRKDDRIRAVAAIDPALTYGIGKTHARDLVERVLLIGLGISETRLPATDFSKTGSGFAPIFRTPRSRPWLRRLISRHSCRASREGRQFWLQNATTRFARPARRGPGGAT